MNRQLTCPVSQVDTSMLLAQELVHFGFINEVNILSVIRLINSHDPRGARFVYHGPAVLSSRTIVIK